MKKAIWLTGCLLIAALLYFVQQQRSSTEQTLIMPEVEKPLNSTLTWWNQQIEAAVLAKQWRVASDFLSRKAAYYQSTNDGAQASATQEQSQQYAAKETAIASIKEVEAITGEELAMEAYVSIPAIPSIHAAKFEPESGIYLGMLGADKRVRFNIKEIEPVYGRKHAIYLTYVGWRKVQPEPRSYFPMQIAQTAASLGGALQVGWEPRYGLDDVKDDEYVRTFAKEAKSTGIPIFLRYASEMNGAWVPWHGDPQKYVEKFRLIHDIMKEEAPNVAMVWSPNYSPINDMDAYYPGDAYVDWIGYSLYATDGPSAQNATNGFLQNFKPLADKYPSKPIMISEGAVSHLNLATNTSFERWAESQLGDLYAYLPRLYPRVKAITYFNYSKDRAIRDKSKDVYDLAENPFADSLYQRLIQSSNYLSQVKDFARTENNVTYTPLASVKGLTGKHNISAYIPASNSKQLFAVGYYQAGRLLGMSYELPWEVELDFSELKTASPLTLIAYNRNMDKLAEKAVPLN
jgi:hypothetical protein